MDGFALLVAAALGIAIFHVAGGTARLRRLAAATPDALPPGPPVVRLVREYRMSPLRDDAENEPIDPAALGLTPALQTRIAAWDAIYQSIFDGEAHPFDADFPDLATEQAWFEEGLAVAAAIRAAWGGRLKVDLSGLGTMLRYARRSLGPGEETPLREAGEMAPRCGVPEIREAIDRLDALARSDPAAREAAAREVVFFTHLLAAVPARYLPEVRRGLDSPEAGTRRRVAEALGMRGGT